MTSLFDIYDDDLQALKEDDFDDDGETSEDLQKNSVCEELEAIGENDLDGGGETNEDFDENNERTISLSLTQKQRSERNRLKALSLKKSRLLSSNPYNGTGDKGRGVFKEKRLVDGGGGFFLEEEEEEERGKPIIKHVVVISAPPPVLPPDRPDCVDCGKEFSDSYLFNTFGHNVCDDCRNTEKDGPHELITKTDAKKEFLIKDSDFEKGERGEEDLRFILRKNPHNPRWGDMKLFLRLQVEKRARAVWGSEEALEKEHEAREEARVVAKTKKYNKKMKELRRVVRSSLFTKDLSSHTHSYGEETYDEDKDEYRKVCESCGHVNTYEKM